jgi:hypothetical protein
MKLYKFKDLADEQKHSHFLQIVLKNSIWCARPDSLNDEDEFRFKLDYRPTSSTVQLLSQAVAQYRTTNFLPPDVSASLAIENDRLEGIAAPIIDGIVEKCRTTIGIVSFSITKSDNHLWEKYGGGGNGVCIEINIPDNLVGQYYHPVQYVPEKIFHVDAFLEAALFPEKLFGTYQNILLTKTRKWAQEEEMRFIGNRQDVNLIFDGQVREITFGPNVPADVFEKLSAQIASHCCTHNIRIAKLSS